MRVICLLAVVLSVHCVCGRVLFPGPLDPDPIEAENDYYYDDEPLTVCYEEIGCFSSAYPFYDPPYRPVSWLPESREEVGTHFYLNTRQNPQGAAAQELTTAFPATISNSFFDPSRDTKFIVHGFTQNGDTQWMFDMQEAFLNAEDCNVIRVDWRKGAVDLYGKATANTRIVGAEISLLIDKIKEVHGMTSSSSFHVIGHSLGAHVAGYAGERQVDLGRITGMDPAGPYYEDTSYEVRLDPTDATFVDVMHTDTDPIYTLGMGIYTKCGHVDIFVNGGKMQPGCDQGIIEQIIGEGSLIGGGVQFVACNHLRAYELFTESINPSSPFTAMRCDGMTYDDYLNGKCFDQTQTTKLGYHSNPSDIATGEVNVVHYMQTHDDTPYSGESYWVKVYMVDKLLRDDVQGVFYVTLFGTQGQTAKLPLNSESMEFKHDQNYKFAVLSADYVGDLTGMYFEWSYDREWYKPWEWDFFNPPSVYVSHIEIEYAEETFRTLMCRGAGTENDKIQADKDQVAFLASSSCS